MARWHTQAATPRQGQYLHLHVLTLSVQLLSLELRTACGMLDGCRCVAASA
jgi:hypothetical protein